LNSHERRTSDPPWDRARCRLVRVRECRPRPAARHGARVLHRPRLQPRRQVVAIVTTSQRVTTELAMRGRTRASSADRSLDAATSSPTGTGITDWERHGLHQDRPDREHDEKRKGRYTSDAFCQLDALDEPSCPLSVGAQPAYGAARSRRNKLNDYRRDAFCFPCGAGSRFGRKANVVGGWPCRTPAVDDAGV
jgi:hypothetical protein